MEVFTEIRNSNGGLLHDCAIVDHAKRKGSALHTSFEWDNDKAAHLHRLNTARKMKGCLRVELEGPGDGPKEYHRVFVHVETEEGVSGHVPLAEAEEYRVFVQNEAENYLAGVRGRLLELAARFDALDDLINAVDKALKILKKKR
jgi:hypothetical protein